MAVSATTLVEWQAATHFDDRSRSRSTNSYYTYPSEFTFWPQFESHAISVVDAELQRIPQHTSFVHRPPYAIVCANESEVQTAVHNNCFDRAQRVLDVNHGGHRFRGHPVPEPLPLQTPADADAAYMPDEPANHALVLVEVKSGAVLPPYTDMLQEYVQYPAGNVRRAIAQMTGYIQRSGAEYAMITTFEKTWCIMALQDAPGDYIKLRISAPIDYKTSGLSMTKAACALALMAFHGAAKHNDGFGGGPRAARTLISPDAPRHSMSTRGGNSSRPSQPPASEGASTAAGSSSPAIYTSEAVQLGRMVGVGRDGVVMEAEFAKQPAVLKLLIPALTESPVAAAAAFETETAAYTALSELQGSAIPQLFGTGVLDDHTGTLYKFIALERVVGDTLSAGQPAEDHGRAAQRALRDIHERGYAHGDLRADNIIMHDGAGGAGVCIIDLGSSSSNAAVEVQRAEELQLAGMFAAKGITLQPLTPPLQRPRRPLLGR